MRDRFLQMTALAIFTALILFDFCELSAQDSSQIVRAGLRSSVYGIKPFPDTTWWYNATKDMSMRYEGSEPSVIWILGYTTNGGCYVGFPNPNPGTSYNKIFFSSNDNHESYLNTFDRSGIKVWLQIEPGFADIPTLIDLVLTQYGHHTCVIGFGVDVEWHKTSSSNNNEGVGVTDEEAQAWVEKVRSYNEDYLLFTKHWLINKMPPTYRDGMVFVDDSQIFPNMQSMVNEFEDWGKAFYPAKVAFQYGYESDKKWWKDLDDPPKNIGDEIVKLCPNTSGLFWVDFTAYDIWPVGFTVTSTDESENILPEFELNQNYPNPFNPSTKISFSLTQSSYDSEISLVVYDTLGNKVLTLFEGYKPAGNHEIVFDASVGGGLASGVYYYQLTAGDFTDTKKMVLLR